MLSALSCFDKLGVASRNCVTTFGRGYRKFGSPDGSFGGAGTLFFKFFLREGGDVPRLLRGGQQVSRVSIEVCVAEQLIPF